MSVQPYEAVVSKMPYAVFPHNGEYAVAHMGYARAYDTNKFQQAWVIDTIAPTIEMAVEAMDKLVTEAKVKKAQDLADLTARMRNR